MRNLFQKTLVCVAFVAIQLVVPVKNLHAGPFFDWLFGRPIVTYPAPGVAAPTAVPVLASTSVTTAAYPTTVGYPVTAGYPVTTNYAAATTTAAGCPCPVTANYVAAPATTCASPCAVPATTAYMPQAVQYSNPTVVGYAPAYRSSWYRVPVTYYRPVTAYTGVGAQPVTVMQPCNTQTYQVRRSPFLFHRPWLPATTTAPYATYAPVVAQPAYTAPAVTVQPTQSNCPCPNAAAVAPSLGTSPYYSPATTVPATTYPATTYPGTTMPATGVPNTHIPSSSDAFPGTSTGVPADQAPALQPIDPSQLTYPNSALNSTPGTTTSASAQRAMPNTPGSVYQVKPIPDPHVDQHSAPARVIAPPLLNPRERTASQTSAKSSNVTQAVYKAAVPAISAPATPAQAPAKQPLWNDSGWHSAGR